MPTRCSGCFHFEVCAFAFLFCLESTPSRFALGFCLFIMSQLKFPLLPDCPNYSPSLQVLSNNISTFISHIAIIMTWTHCVYFPAFVFILFCSTKLVSPIRKSFLPPVFSVSLAPSTCQISWRPQNTKENHKKSLTLLSSQTMHSPENHLSLGFHTKPNPTHKTWSAHRLCILKVPDAFALHLRTQEHSAISQQYMFQSPRHSV